jgi:hypothetical protein
MLHAPQQELKRAFLLLDLIGKELVILRIHEKGASCVCVGWQQG